MATDKDKLRKMTESLEELHENYPFRKISALAKIMDFVQELVVAIASVTKVDVTVVDENLVRIAGSGKYVKELDTVLTPGTISDQVMKTGKIHIIKNPRQDTKCKDCTLKDKCREFAEISFPFNLFGKTIGNIALIAFNEEQRALLLSNSENYIDFIGKTSVLLQHRIESLEQSKQVNRLSQQLELIIGKMDQGIIFVDNKGLVQLFNKIAKKQLGKSLRSGARITKVLPELSMPMEQTNDYLFIKEEETYSYSIKLIEKTGALIEINPVRFIQEKEQSIRRRMSSKQNAALATFDDLVGNHPKFMESVNLARKYCRVDATVLITAETGTGKELFAQSIHNLSTRRNEPFVAINCAALPENLLESELFGYEPGSFTGAKRTGKMGLFEQAHGGTIFLDEIAEIPVPLQSSLLRVLQNKEVRRIGGEKLIPVDVRVIAATNKKIQQMVSEALFREDLYYRLNMLRLRIPPLCDRPDDIPLLVQYFAIATCRQYKRPPLAFTKDALALMCKYQWPGNIRELYNVVQRAVLMAEESMIDVESIRSILFDEEIVTGETLSINLVLDGSFNNITLQIIEKLMNRYEDEEEVCRLTGLSKTTIWRRLKNN